MIAPKTEASLSSTIEYSVGATIWRTLLLTALVFLTIPQWLSPIGIGLDGSWGTALHLAFERGLVHGRDFLFTYGPLGFAMMAKEIGVAAPHALALRLGLLGFWWVSVGVLLFRVQGVVAPLVFAATLAFCGMALEYEFNFALIGVLILAVCSYLLLAELDDQSAWAIPAAFLAGAAMLTKFNAGVACTGALGAWSLYRLARNRSPREWLQQIGLALVYFGSLAVFFRVYSGPIAWLPSFLWGSKELASAYSAQMGLDDPAAHPWLVVTIVGLTSLGLAISLWRRSPLASAFVLIAFPMFVLYKGAVVRQSIGHFLSAWPVMVSLSALLLPIASRTPRSRIVWTTLVASFLALGFHYAPASLETLATRGAENWLSLCRFERTRNVMHVFDAKIKESHSLPASMLERIGTEPVDIYPWETSYAWSNDLNWRPRPIFQSYTTYTPYLDRLDAEFYRGEQAPTFIVYSHIAIDRQNPCIVDPRTWIEILRWYDFVEQVEETLLLQRRNEPRWKGVEHVESAAMRFREFYQAPDAGPGLVFLKAEFQLSWLGRLQSFLYKIDPPLIRVDYKDGSSDKRRLVWRNAASGFLLSNLPRDVDGVRRFMESGAGDEVAAVSFHDPSNRMSRTFQVTAMRSEALRAASNSTIPADRTSPSQ